MNLKLNGQKVENEDIDNQRPDSTVAEVDSDNEIHPELDIEEEEDESESTEETDIDGQPKRKRMRQSDQPVECEYDVEEVLDMKIINGVRYYLLKWHGESNSVNLLSNAILKIP